MALVGAAATGWLVAAGCSSSPGAVQELDPAVTVAATTPASAGASTPVVATDAEQETEQQTEPQTEQGTNPGTPRVSERVAVLVRPDLDDAGRARVVAAIRDVAPGAPIVWFSAEDQLAEIRCFAPPGSGPAATISSAALQPSFRFRVSTDHPTDARPLGDVEGVTGVIVVDDPPADCAPEGVPIP